SGRERATFDGWRASDLGRTGARSAVAVLGLDGRILSSFAHGLPASVFEDTPAPGAPPPPPPPAEPSAAAPPPGTSSPAASGTTRGTPAGEPASPVIVEASLRVLSLAVPLLRGDVLVTSPDRPRCR